MDWFILTTKIYVGACCITLLNLFVPVEALFVGPGRSPYGPGLGGGPAFVGRISPFGNSYGTSGRSPYVPSFKSPPVVNPSDKKITFKNGQTRGGSANSVQTATVTTLKPTTTAVAPIKNQPGKELTFRAIRSSTCVDNKIKTGGKEYSCSLLLRNDFVSKMLLIYPNRVMWCTKKPDVADCCATCKKVLKESGVAVTVKATKAPRTGSKNKGKPTVIQTPTCKDNEIWIAGGSYFCSKLLGPADYIGIYQNRFNLCKKPKVADCCATCKVVNKEKSPPTTVKPTPTSKSGIGSSFGTSNVVKQTPDRVANQKSVITVNQKSNKPAATDKPATSQNVYQAKVTVIQDKGYSESLGKYGLESDVDDSLDTIIHNPQELRNIHKRSARSNINSAQVDHPEVTNDSARQGQENREQGKARTERDSDAYAYEEEDEDLNSGYLPWNEWSTCSATCGYGSRSRRRTCKDKLHCFSGSLESQKCFIIECT